MSDLTKILAENQKEMLKLIAPMTKKQIALTIPEETDSESENVPATATSATIKTKTTATAHIYIYITSKKLLHKKGRFCCCVKKTKTGPREKELEHETRNVH